MNKQLNKAAFLLAPKFYLAIKQALKKCEYFQLREKI